MFKVYELEKTENKLLDQLLNDDILGRQSIQYKNGEDYGYPSSYIVIIEGSEDIFKRVGEIFGSALKELGDKKSQKIYEKIKNEENSSKEGMGFIFG